VFKTTTNSGEKIGAKLGGDGVEEEGVWREPKG
jgi:hypothetical protein